MYCEAKALMEKVVDRMALQSTPTFRVALTRLDDFFEALNSGKVVTFADSEVAVFPGLSQLSSAQRKQAQAKQDREIARNLAAQYCSGTVSKLVLFADVAALLDGPYSHFNAKAMVDALVLPAVEISGSHSARQRSAGQDIPVVEAIPQFPKIIAAIDAIRLKQDIDLLAYWPDFGYATFDQLDTMATLVEARTRFGLVMQTIKWIESGE
ncbi:Hypothetical protein PHPALM_10207 [Phytophthora palmivora]|uniref:Uncharacterized protein n=1 Tax=Phytophthora palmivora TaxID=4796 RepID=A0A2P4Y5C0_9STRA|nr:Hypothetical protein PHPALM_10207 [Phytophthora palmivora]